MGSEAVAAQGTRCGYVQADGAELYYEDIGQGPAVILVNGTSGHSAYWKQQVPVLVLSGEKDIMTSPTQMQALAKHILGASNIIVIAFLRIIVV